MTGSSSEVPCPYCGAFATTIPGMPGALCPSCGEAILVANEPLDRIRAAGERFDRLLTLPNAASRYRGAEGFRWTSAVKELRLDICPARQLEPHRGSGTILLTDRHLFYIEESGDPQSISAIPLTDISGVSTAPGRRLLMRVCHLELGTSRGSFHFVVGPDAGESIRDLIEELRKSTRPRPRQKK
jgi:hypothetical protein